MKISNILFLHVVKLLVPIKVYQEKTSDDDSDQNRCHRKHADRLREPDSTTPLTLGICDDGLIPSRHEEGHVRQLSNWDA